MQSMFCRKLAIGIAGATMMALSVVAVAPVGAADPDVGMVQNTSAIDTAEASDDTHSHSNDDIVYATTPAPEFVPVANVPFVTTVPVTQLSGGTQVDNSATRDTDHDDEAAQG